MNSKDVLIIDYGIGNLHSVSKAFEYIGARPTISRNPADLLLFPKVVLPGVGAFENGMRALVDQGFDQALRELPSKGVPLLAICLGMQLLLDESTEFGIHKGLGLIPGRVDKIPSLEREGRKIKIPHIGWNTIYPAQDRETFDNPILAGYSDISPSFYFVHSYRVLTSEPQHCLAKCNYQGIEIAAVIGKGNIIGCQFHPEKSGESGLNLLRNFISL